MSDLEQRIRDMKEATDGPVDCYVLFSSHTDAMVLYSLVKAKGIGARISTTPRDARSSCGVSLLISCDDALAVEQMALDEPIPIEGIVPLPCQINPRRDVYC